MATMPIQYRGNLAVPVSCAYSAKRSLLTEHDGSSANISVMLAAALAVMIIDTEKRR